MDRRKLLIGFSFVLSQALGVYASMIMSCPARGDYYISDHYDRCRYYRCSDGVLMKTRSFRCAPGSGTQPGYHGRENPCTERVESCKLAVYDNPYAHLDPYDKPHHGMVPVPAPVPAPVPEPAPEPVPVPTPDHMPTYPEPWTPEPPHHHEHYGYELPYHTHELPPHTHQLPDHQHQLPDYLYWHLYPDYQYQYPDHGHNYPDHQHPDHGHKHPDSQHPDHGHKHPDHHHPSPSPSPNYPSGEDHMKLGYLHPYPIHYPSDTSKEDNALGQVIYKLQGMHVPGGFLVRGVNDLHYCLHACAKNTTCLGFDFNAVDRTCWFHGMMTVCNPPIAKSDCTNFKFDPCPSTTTTSAVMTTMTGTNPMMCFDNMSILGGTAQAATLNTQALCEAACVASATCVGYDFDRTAATAGTTSCFFHTTTTECTMLIANTNTIHCRFTTCGTTTGNLVGFPMMHALGGTPQPTITSATACIAGCQALGAAVCVAVDFDSASMTCWFHDAVTCSQRQAKNQCMHIQIATCP